MNSLPEKIDVVCSRCGESFDAWNRAHSDPTMTSTCPHCGHQLGKDHLLRQDGTWFPVVDEVDEPAR